MRKTIFLCIFLCLATGGSAGAWTTEDRADFQKANEAYREENFQEALSGYGALAQRYPQDAWIHYNLGNSHYRLGEVGKAILDYERARVYGPRHHDIRQNLNYLTGLLEYRIEDKRNWYLKIGAFVLRYFSENEINFAALFSYFLFVASWAFVLFFRRGLPWGWIRKSLILSMVIFGTLAFAKGTQMHVLRDAIVLENEIEVRYGPSGSDRIAFRLGEGLKVHVVDRREKWSRILLVNGESGWVRNAQIGLVQP